MAGPEVEEKSPSVHEESPDADGLTDLVCDDDETLMTSGTLFTCSDEDDGTCPTKCNSASCGGQYEIDYGIPSGASVEIDCTSTYRRSRLLLRGGRLDQCVSNGGNETLILGGRNLCVAADETMMTMGTVAGCSEDDEDDECDVECTQGCVVTSSDAVTIIEEKYYAIGTSFGEDQTIDCGGTEGAFCCVDLEDWASATDESPPAPSGESKPENPLDSDDLASADPDMEEQGPSMDEESP